MMRRGERKRKKLWALGLIQLQLVNVATNKPLFSFETDKSKQTSSQAANK